MTSEVMTGGGAQIVLVVSTGMTRMSTTILVKEGVTKIPSNTNLACGLLEVLLFPVVAEAYPLLCQIGVALGYLCLPNPPDPAPPRLAVKVKWYVLS